MKKCPFCAEEIQNEAIKCRYCGSMLNVPMDNADARKDPDVIPEEARAILKAKGKIQALEYVRSKKGLNVGEAMAYVDAVAANEDPDAAAASAQVTTKGCGGCAAALVIVAIGIAIVMTLRSDPDPSTPGGNGASDHGNMAFIQCKDFVRRRLRAPSTASFPFLDFQSTGNGQTYLVRSYVDAENAFGAKLRNDWTCRVRFNGGDDADIVNWTLVDLNLTER